MDDSTTNNVSMKHGYDIYPVGDPRRLEFWRRVFRAWRMMRATIRAREKIAADIVQARRSR